MTDEEKTHCVVRKTESRWQSQYHGYRKMAGLSKTENMLSASLRSLNSGMEGPEAFGKAEYGSGQDGDERLPFGPSQDD